LASSTDPSRADTSHARGSSQEGLFNRDGLDADASEVLVVEGPLDAALLLSYGRNAVALQSATAKLSAADLAALKQYPKIYLIGDMDGSGQRAMDNLGAALPPEKISRVRLRGVKDVGDLWAKYIATFDEELKVALRVSDIQRKWFTWDDLETEAELMAGGTGVLPFLVQDLLPLDDLTMLAGREGSCKTILALYIGKCVANGVPVFGCLKTEKKPVLYLDAENHEGTHKVYPTFFTDIGPEIVRFRTLKYGVPALSDPALLKLVEEKRPLLIVDSLIRFCGTRDRDNTEMTLIMEQLSHLVTAGATVLLIHHTLKADEEEYANSFVIAATVAFWYAITSENSLGIQRVKMIHKKARAGSKINRNLVAFPAILDLGMLTLDGDAPKTDKELVLDFVSARGGCNFTTIKDQLRGIGIQRKKAAIDQAIETGELVKTEAGREVIFSVQKIGSGLRNSSFSFSSVPEPEPIEKSLEANSDE
jgi:5S rRNA maturation endonuclease (ribonuclease M5)